ncbi:MAG: hypothetical protein ACI35O_12850 [Bacillaceae bacterium]
MLLLVLGEEVWNPVDNCPYEPIPNEIREQIYLDEKFLDYKKKIEDFWMKY